MTIRKNVLLTSGVISIVVIVIGIFGTYALCNNNERCINILHLFFLNFLPIVPVFVFSLIMCWMREEVYHAWFRFARWWAPLSMIAIFIAPEYSSDWIYPIEKGSVALFSSTIFVVVSIFIVTLKIISTRKKN